MWKDFLGFLVVTGLQLAEVKHTTFLAFMQYLSDNAMSPANIGNYMAAIRANYIIIGMDTTPLRHEQIAMFHKSLKLNIPFSPKINCLIDIDLLQRLIEVASILKHPEIYTALFSFAFFSFLRLPNILPHSAKSFDVSRHLARGDIFFDKDSATVLIKWSKTIQNRKDVASIVIPMLGETRICPVKNLKQLLALQPGGPNTPLFQISRAKN